MKIYLNTKKDDIHRAALTSRVGRSGKDLVMMVTLSCGAVKTPRSMSVADFVERLCPRTIFNEGIDVAESCNKVGYGR